LVLAFEVVERHSSPYLFGPETKERSRQATNVVLATDLRPVTNAPAARAGGKVASTPETHARFVAPGQRLPLAPKLDDDAQGRQPYPDYECILYDWGWVWLVPATDEHGPPLRAYAAKMESFRTPAYAYPLRIIFLPVGLVVDLTLWRHGWGTDAPMMPNGVTSAGSGLHVLFGLLAHRPATAEFLRSTPMRANLDFYTGFTMV
jgi:hypothetical protein